MALKRLTQRAGLWAGVLLVGTAAHAQGLIGDLQLFAPPRLDAFGGGREANQGFFFCYDQLYWWIQAPEAATIGAPGERFVITRVINYPINPNDLPPPGIYYTTEGYTTRSTGDTSDLNWKTSWGERFEFGWMGQHDGILVSLSNLQHQSQYLTFNQVEVFFDDPEGLLVGLVGYGNRVVGNPLDPDTWTLIQEPVTSPLPVTFTNLQVSYRADFWSVELEYLRRSHMFRRGGYLEFLAGVRYLELDDQIRFQGTGGIFDGSVWGLSAENHVIGPQLGVRYFKLAGRWMLNAEGRFTAGFNSQNLHLESNLTVPTPGTVGFPTAWPGSKVTQAEYQNEWAPIVELRVELRYLITKAINLRVGWTGMWMDGIARSPYMIDYTLPLMGMDTSNNQEDAFVHGLTFGVDINR